ncbi:hypothetical protein AB4Z54_25770, partial [Streptomyces sp. MCAF7]
MAKALRWLLALVMLVGAVGAGVGSATAAPTTAAPTTAAPTTAAPTTTAATTAKPAAAEPDIKDRILAIPGMSFVEEKPYDGYRFLVLTYTQ